MSRDSRPNSFYSAVFPLIVSSNVERVADTPLLNPRLSQLTGLQPEGYAASVPLAALSNKEANQLDKHILLLLDRHPNIQCISHQKCQKFNQEHAHGFSLFVRWLDSVWSVYNSTTMVPLRDRIYKCCRNGSHPRINQLEAWLKTIGLDNLKGHPGFKRVFVQKLPFRSMAIRIALAESLLGFPENTREDITSVSWGVEISQLLSYLRYCVGKSKSAKSRGSVSHSVRSSKHTPSKIRPPSTRSVISADQAKNKGNEIRSALSATARQSVSVSLPAQPATIPGPTTGFLSEEQINQLPLVVQATYERYRVVMLAQALISYVELENSAQRG